MKNRIIEICELGKPQSIIHREKEPITELIKTDSLIEELNQQLLLHNVSNSFISISEKKPPSNIELLVQNPEGQNYLAHWRKEYNIFSCQAKSQNSFGWKWKLI